MKRFRFRLGTLLIVFAVVALGIAAYTHFSVRPLLGAYESARRYFEHAEAGDDSGSAVVSPWNDLNALLNSPHGPAYLERLDDASDWVAYDGEQDIVYYLTREQDGKVKFNQQRVRGGAGVDASVGYTTQIELRSVGFHHRSLELAFRTRVLDEGDESVLEGMGLERDADYVVTLPVSELPFRINDYYSGGFFSRAVRRR